MRVAATVLVAPAVLVMPTVLVAATVLVVPTVRVDVGGADVALGGTDVLLGATVFVLTAVFVAATVTVGVMAEQLPDTVTATPAEAISTLPATSVERLLIV